MRVIKKTSMAFITLSSLIMSMNALAEDVIVKMTTNKGPITLVLDDEKAPITVNNFVEYANAGYYEGTIFHRVIPGFMIQGGGFDKELSQKDTRSPIKNEAENGLKNVRGSIAMARTGEVDSATSQFFINVADNKFLDNGERDYGYAVFGKVTEGLDIVDVIANVKTSNQGPHQNVPVEPVVIEKVEILK
ncbi:peptidylprolyl isomerase [Thorsellia kenyensis]|uniref:Peptidyl-prolyl cis-trans isomerase n=1 Tax=Thorsellia kenyensis TaxID=1549888 RepID=A0ABV6CCY8_9GAMM